MEDEQVTAILGLVLLHFGGEARIPFETVERGLPSGHGVRIIPDHATDELIIKIEKWEVKV